MALDPRIEAVRIAYGLAVEDFWQIPQNKQWVCKHAALEVVATKANVEWGAPQIIEAKTESGIAVLAVTGKMGERLEWATGEASPKNNKNSYPWAMAEKRAKDRVVLKLVGIHGLVYSEDEADDFKQPNSSPGRPSFNAQAAADRIKNAIAKKQDVPSLNDLYRHEGECLASIEAADKILHAQVMAEFASRKTAFMQKEAA